MRYQLGNTPWPCGATLIPASTILNFSKPESEWEWETIAKDKVIPLAATALDFDAALAGWIAYPHCRKRLQQRLGPYDAEMFERIKGDDALLAFWKPRKPAEAPKAKPKSDFADQLTAALAARSIKPRT